ncbi:MAG TPA: NYN domain-containing protein [Xanthomonadales bacterium]|nr:NYN domain-containing protein [Xanthomonadales bacterium]
MANTTKSLALFCDFENIALGVQDAHYKAFEIEEILERLLVKGNIVVKKAYCDWQRYKSYKEAMHEASFELIEIPHLRQSGKNSADIRMVVDALDLCYTKSHVDTFVIMSGDSDFSPLVSKLRENDKEVIGVGVKNSSSDLLIANCDEFIFYDDIMRTALRRKPSNGQQSINFKNENGKKDSPDRQELMERRAKQAFDQVLETVDDLVSERGDEELLWGSMVKQALKRRKPGFNESYHGFRSFGSLLEAMEKQKLLELKHDEKSGGYIIEEAS